jgi:hypothetical protein
VKWFFFASLESRGTLGSPTSELSRIASAIRVRDATADSTSLLNNSNQSTSQIFRNFLRLRSGPVTVLGDGSPRPKPAKEAIVGRSIAIEFAEIYSFSTKGVEYEPPGIHNEPLPSALAEVISEDFSTPGSR